MLRTNTPTVVTPPASAAAVSLSISSSGARWLPKWICGSTTPGKTTLPRASTSAWAGPRSSPMATIFPSLTPTSAANTPWPGRTIRPPDTFRSSMEAVLVNGAFLHHQAHLAQRRNIPQRVAVHHDDVGQLSRLQRPEAVRLLQQLG